MPDRFLQIMGQSLGKDLQRGMLLVDTPLQLAGLDRHADDPSQRLRCDRRLGDIVLRSLLHGLDGDGLVALAGQQDDRQMRIPGPDELQHLDPVSPRQRVIQQDAAGLGFCDRLDAALAARFLHEAQAPAERFRQNTPVKRPIIGAVIDHEDADLVVHAHQSRQQRDAEPVFLHAADRGDQSVEIHRLLDIGAGAQLIAFRHVPLVAGGGENDDGYQLQRRILLHDRQHLSSVDARHVQIEEDQGGQCVGGFVWRRRLRA